MDWQKVKKYFCNYSAFIIKSMTTNFIILLNRDTIIKSINKMDKRKD